MLLFGNIAYYGIILENDEVEDTIHNKYDE
jgi:hypothetical protein